jgi:hypothetical protein
VKKDTVTTRFHGLSERTWAAEIPVYSFAVEAELSSITEKVPPEIN